MLENYRCSWTATLLLIKSGVYSLTLFSSNTLLDDRAVLLSSARSISCQLLLSAPACVHHVYRDNIGLVNIYVALPNTQRTPVFVGWIPPCRTLDFSFVCVEITPLFTAPSPSVHIMRTIPSMMANSAAIVTFSVFIIELSKRDGFS